MPSKAFDAFVSGFTGRSMQSFRDPNSPEEILKKMQAEAAAKGFKSVDEMINYNRGQREIDVAAQGRQKQKDEADLRTTVLSNESKNADLFSRSGLDAGESATFAGKNPDDLKRLNKGQQGAHDVAGIDAVAGMKKKLIKNPETGMLESAENIVTDDKTRAEVVGMDLNKERMDEIEREIQQEENDQGNADRLFGLDMQKHKLSKTKEERYQIYQDLNIQVLGEQLEDLQNGQLTKGTITPGQAVNVAQTILVRSGAIDEDMTSEGAAGLVASLSQKIIHAMENPRSASSMKINAATLDSIQRVEEGRQGREAAGTIGTFEDEEAAETLFGRKALEAAAKEQGEEEDPEAPQKPEPDPDKPGWDDGTPDMRALDPNVSIQELFGTAEQDKRAQNREIDADNEQFEEDARINMKLGIPFAEWDPALQMWSEGIKPGVTKLWGGGGAGLELQTDDPPEQ